VGSGHRLQRHPLYALAPRKLQTERALPPPLPLPLLLPPPPLLMVMWLRVLVTNVTSVQGRVVLPVGTSSTSQQTLMCWNTLVDQVTHTHDL
jgi:hypothetical protein